MSTRQKLLLIEDDPWLADSYRRILSTDYNVRTVKQSSEAIAMIDFELPQLIIADVMLDRGLVIDLLHELQSHNDTSVIPVILCSSLASSLDASSLIKYGVIKILDKSTVTPQKLKDSVAIVLTETQKV